MAQWFAVAAPDAAGARGWLERACAAFNRIAGLQAQETAESGPVAAALFPFLGRPAAAIVRPGEGPAWIMGAGSWFFENSGTEEGLRRMARATGDVSRCETWMRKADGAFAIAFASQDDPGEFFVCTDRLGTVHVYSAVSGDCSLVCTSSLVLAAVLDPGWDPIALRHFFSYGNLFERRSLFRGVEKLPPATFARFRLGRPAEERRHWSLAEACFDRATQAGGAEALAGALRETVSTIAAGYGRPLMDLTGGFDSRGLLGAMLGAGLRFDTVVSGEDDDPDVRVAGLVAREFGVNLLRQRGEGDAPVETLWKLARRAVSLVDGEYDALLYASTLRAHSEMSAGFDASINGSNGEICKGYWWELLLPHIGRRGDFDPRLVAAKRYAIQEDYPHLLAFQYDESLVEEITGIIRRATAGMEGLPNTALVDVSYLALRMQRWQGRIASATGRIWPCISPYAFRGPMEAALATPPPERVRHRLSRRLIESQNRRLAELPLAQGYPALPLRWNTFHRFGPLAVEVGKASWRQLRRRLGKAPQPKLSSSYPLARLWSLREVCDVLDAGRMVTRDLYRPDTLRLVLQRSREGGSRETATAGRVLTIELAARALCG